MTTYRIIEPRTASERRRAGFVLALARVDDDTGDEHVLVTWHSMPVEKARGELERFVRHLNASSACRIGGG